MDAKKKNGKIQKNVEESILDAVTKIRSDEPSFNPFAAEVPQKPDSPGHENQTELSLWNLINKNPNGPLADSESQPIDFQGVDLGQKKEESRAPANSEIPAYHAPPAFNRGEAQKTQQVSVQAPSAPAIKKPPFKPSDDLIPDMPKAEDRPQWSREPSPPGFTGDSGDGFPFNSIQAKLYESDHLKIAQKKIESLEKESDRLRIENERLSAAAGLFQKRSEENGELNSNLEKKLLASEERFAEERRVLKRGIEERDQNLKALREKIEDLESRLTSDIRKSRSRERELENRLELLKMEKISLVGSKDEIILDLKRQVDQLNHELGNYRKKAAELGQTIEANQEQFRRTVRALRLALTNLEVNEQSGGRLKKAE